jgi:integrase
MTTYSSIADDLAAFWKFLDEFNIDWMAFPEQKLLRPTYRFNSHLKHSVANGEIAPTTAKRHMSTVIRFYRWLVREGLLVLEYEPWKEADRYVQFTDSRGFHQIKRVTSTDLSVHVPQQQDPYNGTLDDGGKLRPLTLTEQEWLIDALNNIGNTEMTLIHLFSLLTGARIQTILTFRVRHIELNLEDVTMLDIRFPVGPGTGIDTKFDKRMVLHIPAWFYRQLQIYVRSERAKKRRLRALGGDIPNQYLFLSQRGAPLYEGKDSVQNFNDHLQLRHMKTGQAVRQFIRAEVVPYIRIKYKVPKFSYRFHDLRATAGMNWSDHQLKLVEEGKSTLYATREFVKNRMGHASSAVTDRYLQYRDNLKLVRWAEESHETHLQLLAKKIFG